MPASRDHYDVLGVSRSASADEIRSAHRRLARQYHPDLNKDPGASDRFNEVQRAYEILSDPEKRKKYDQFGDAAFEPGAAAGGPGAGHGGGHGAAWQEMDPEAMRDIFGDMFGDAFGGGAGGGRRRGRGRAPRPTQGPDREFELAIGFAVAANGGTEQLRLRASDGSAETIDVKVPAGVADGSKLRVRGRGEPGFHGGPRGDLILTVRVGAHPWFVRDGLDLSVDVPITIAEAALSFFGVDSVPVRMADAEAALVGSAATGDAVVAAAEAAAEIVREQIRPTADVHGSANYRRHLAGVLITQGVAQALDHARNGDRDA